jgi:hypothetical protein
MKRIALAVALVVMAAGACQKAEDRGMAADSAADTTHMSDTTHATPPDTTQARRP